MPYATVADLPASVRKLSDTQQRQWMNVWNSAYRRCKKKGGADAACESSAFAQANGVVKHDAKSGFSLAGLRDLIGFKKLDTSDQNDLPDACFLYIEPGGKKDAEGKTTPRSKRHLPVKKADGSIDVPHLRNAISRLGQPDTLKGILSDSAKKALQRKAQSMLSRVHNGQDPNYAGAVATFDLGEPTPLYESDDGMVYRPGLIFRAGDYPDKGYSMTPEEIREAVAAFDPGTSSVAVDMEHVPTVLDGLLGEVVDLSTNEDASELHGVVALPKWLDEVLPARKVSATWDRKTKHLAGLAIVRNPRVSDAALMAAFSVEGVVRDPDYRKSFFEAYSHFDDPDGDGDDDSNDPGDRHDTPQGQGLMQAFHDIAARRGAVCKKPKKKVNMHSDHEHDAVQAIHDMAADHGAECHASVRDSNGLSWPKEFPGIRDANSMYFSAGTGSGTTQRATKEGRRMSKLEEFFRALLTGEESTAGGEAGAEAGAPAAMSTNTPAPSRDPRLSEMEEENRRLRAENDRIRSERIREQAVAFADAVLHAGKATPAERDTIIEAYVESATSDISYGPAKFSMDGKETTRPRTDTLKRLYEARPAHMLTKEEIPAALHRVIMGQDATPDPSAPKAASDEELARLVSMTPIGRGLIGQKNGK